MKDLSKLNEEETVDYLTGKRITFTNTISGRPEEVEIRSDTKKPQLRNGVIEFLSLVGHRYVNVENITSVSRRKVA